jgi:hypothetical protein
MTIDCHDIEQFLNIIVSLSRRGIGFKADGGSLRITLTGAH